MIIAVVIKLVVAHLKLSYAKAYIHTATYLNCGAYLDVVSGKRRQSALDHASVGHQDHQSLGTVSWNTKLMPRPTWSFW